jgi:hypothetical protein
MRVQCKHKATAIKRHKNDASLRHAFANLHRKTHTQHSPLETKTKKTKQIARCAIFVVLHIRVQPGVISYIKSNLKSQDTTKTARNAKTICALRLFTS